jgi:hypothetical protein
MPVKPSEQEEEYFARREFERRRQALSEQASATAEEERLRCPKCGAALVAVPYRGVELDKCSRCEGVWLDVGELDHVLGEEAGFLGSLKHIFR